MLHFTQKLGDSMALRNVGILHFTLKMEAAKSSETFVSYHYTIWRDYSEDLDLKSMIILIVNIYSLTREAA
jgi:hypothetical protein